MVDLTELTIDTYNNLAKQYEKDYFNNTDDMQYVEKFIQYLNGNKILDVGCGCGNLSIILAEKNYDVTGIDLSDKMLEIAKVKVPSVKFEKQDMRKTNFQNETFDGLFVCRSLFHIKSEEIPQTLAEFYRILRNNGTIAIIVRVTEKPFEQIEKEVYNPNLNIFFKYFSEDEIIKELDSANFKIKYKDIREILDIDSEKVVKNMLIIAEKGV